MVYCLPQNVKVFKGTSTKYATINSYLFTPFRIKNSTTGTSLCSQKDANDVANKTATQYKNLSDSIATTSINNIIEQLFQNLDIKTFLPTYIPSQMLETTNYGLTPRFY